MEIINSYFKGLTFTQVDEKEGFTIYAACIASGLQGGKKRYVLIFVPLILSFKKTASIHELAWKNLQTRELSYSYKLKQQHWTFPREAQDIHLTIENRTKDFSSYGTLNFPFEILLLHNPKKKTIYQYRDKLTLSGAVEMFNTVINNAEEVVPQNSNTFFTPIIKPQGGYEPPSMNNWFGNNFTSINPSIDQRQTQNYGNTQVNDSFILIN